MATSYEIDTSILVQLATGQPHLEYQATVRFLTRLVEKSDLFVSNQVILESWLALQLHYGVEESAARHALSSNLESGLVSPFNGSVTWQLVRTTGARFAEALATDDHAALGLVILTNDEPSAGLPGHVNLCDVASR